MDQNEDLVEKRSSTDTFENVLAASEEGNSPRARQESDSSSASNYGSLCGSDNNKPKASSQLGNNSEPKNRESVQKEDGSEAESKISASYKGDAVKSDNGKERNLGEDQSSSIDESTSMNKYYKEHQFSFLN